MSNFFILGAADPEMAAIESLLASSGQRFGHASIAGVRVHSGNAYKADGVLFGTGGHPVDDDTLVLVECDLIRIPSCWAYCESCGDHPDPTFVGLGSLDLGSPGGMGGCGDHHRWHQPKITRVDHHRPGDPGYGRPPEEFLAASSIGQVVSLLNGHGKAFFEDGQWLTSDGGEHRDVGGNVVGLPHCGAVPVEMILIAAADHCLEAAYRGRCPGVDPDALMAWRAQSRAEFQKRPIEAVMADIESARRILRESIEQPRMTAWDYCPHCDSYEHGDCMGVPPLEYADLRAQPPIPELPEAAAREGIPFLASMADRDGRKKVVLQAVPQGSDLVKRFLAGELVPGLVDHYGDAARGFAGGYLKAAQ